MWVSNGPIAARFYVQWLGLHIQLYVLKYTKYWLKKGAGTAAILEGVGISAPLMGRYVGRASG